MLPMCYDVKAPHSISNPGNGYEGGVAIGSNPNQAKKMNYLWMGSFLPCQAIVRAT